MALSGTINGSVTLNSNYFSFYLKWSAQQSVSGNYSDVTVTTYWQTNNKYQDFDTVGSRKASITIDGSTSSITSVFDTGDNWDKKGNPYQIQTYTKRVYHNSDGTKSIKISARANGHAASWGPSSSTASSADCTASGTITLNTIPRASVIDSVSCATSYLNGTITYKYTPQSESFYNRCNISLNLNGEFISIKSIDIGKKSAEQQIGTVTLSASELTKIYSNLPKTTKGTLRFTLRTYSDSGYTTQVGSAGYKEITLTIPTTIKPKLGTITIDPINITKTDGTTCYDLVQGKNKIWVKVEGSSAGDGSSIKSYTFTALKDSTVIESVTTTSNGTYLGPFSKTGTLKFRVTVTDSRGSSTSNSGSEPSCTCYTYSAPSITSFSIYRANSDGTPNMNGTYIQCDYTPKYSSVNSTNSATVTAYYNGKTKTGASGSARINLNGDVSTTYKVYLEIEDKYDGKSSTSTVTIFGQSRILNITSDGTGVAIGKMAESNNLFECRWPAKFNDKMTIQDAGGPVLNGYSVGTLGPGTSISSDDDLNNYTTAGVFRSTGSTISETLSNTPHTSSGFKLVVEYLGSSSYLRQVVIPRISSCQYYVRYYSDGTWYPWKIFESSDAIETAISKIDSVDNLTIGTNQYYDNSKFGIDMSNSDIINANGIYFKDATDSNTEGIHFYRSDGYWDTLYADDGVLRLHPNRGTGTGLSGFRLYDTSYLQFCRGTCTLNCSSETTISFSSAMSGTPTILLTPKASTAGILTAKVTDRSSTGFTAIIGGDPVSSNTDIYFMYLAIYY